ncbi:hypothetical protein PAXRUDRAFT_835150 [Paxillus rubicundulus Ve08.2h10]|uniref:Uncharacterized protein n=1 Tax=Paxillus rubicundulus Ve08.2h10 TaxID=930991 RepID=A0A0D0D0D5_9AGAM|nr:hypothetical protein PAXRUDRAFT_835150 [Paxillus rubicundulus Ve08.2h10]
MYISGPASESADHHAGMKHLKYTSNRAIGPDSMARAIRTRHQIDPTLFMLARLVFQELLTTAPATLNLNRDRCLPDS